MAKNDNGVVEFQFHRPENRTKWENFQRAIYDPQSKQCLGRTPKNWGQLLLFYTIFYIVLAALFAICMQGLFATLDENEPKWTLDSSLIGTSPGLGFRPISSQTQEGSLIRYDLRNQTTSQKWIDLVDSFLKPYKSSQTGDNYVNCHFNQTLGPKDVCVTTAEQLGDCNSDLKYGYLTASPCIFLKLNRIYGWRPQFYTASVEGMPSDLVKHIDSRSNAEKEQIWVSCEGLDDVDKENIKGFNYSSRGFAGYYYPYKNVRNYLSPIIAVKILDITPNKLVSIECRAWAGNIEYSRKAQARAGSITFEIQVDAEVQIPKNDSKAI